MLTAPRSWPGSAIGARPGVALFVLSVVSLFNQIDRQLLSILQVPLKIELSLSDTRLGLLTGIAFATVYGLFALPMSRLADRTSRKWLMAGALAVWSLMTGLSGLAQSFFMLVLCRMGVAFGESCCTPATLSLISDYFKPNARVTAIAIWSLCVPIGVMAGAASGGWLCYVVGWRRAFILAGIAGLLLLPSIAVLREPERGRNDRAAFTRPERTAALEALAILWSSAPIRMMMLGGAFQGFVLSTVMVWSAPFYARVYHMKIAAVGLVLALIFGIGGGAGSLLGGALSARLTRKNPAGFALTAMIGSLICMPLALVQFLSPTLTISLLIGGLGFLAMNLYLSPLNASIQSLARPEMRAFAAALMLIFTSVLGSGLGPLTAGALSDYFAAHGHPEDSLRWAISAVLLVALPAAFVFWRAAVHLAKQPSSSRPKLDQQSAHGGDDVYLEASR